MSLSLKLGATPLALKGWGVSAALHAALLSAIATGSGVLVRVQLAAGPRANVLQVEISGRAEEPSTEGGAPEYPLVVAAPAARVFAIRRDNGQLPEQRPIVVLPSSDVRPVPVAISRSATGVNEVSSPKTAPVIMPRRQPRPMVIRGSIHVAAVAGSDGRNAPSFEGNAPPTYPLAAVAARLEGTVLLRVYVTSEGDVVRVEIAQSSGHAILDAEAVKAVRRWRGLPAKVGGVAEESTELLPVRFRL